MRRSLSIALAILLLLVPVSPLAEGIAYYEIFPASFYDANGDGVGDLDGIAFQLDYLQALGVDGLWLMPIHPSPSYHKYDVLDYYAVDPSYGTLDDFQALLTAMHARDMKLLMDLVINHTSSSHPWFLSAAGSLAVEPCGAEKCIVEPPCRAHNPFVDYYHFSSDAIPGWHPVGGVDGWYYMGHFTWEMPDLNLSNEAVKAEILAICSFWLDKGVDGFRLDAVPHYFEENIHENNAFTQWLMTALEEMKPNVYTVGEVWKDAGSIAKYYEGGLSSLFNFPFSGAEGTIVAAIRSKKGEAFAQKAADWQAVWSAFEGAGDAPFLSNHDNARIAGTLMQKTENLKLAASMYLTLPGTPFLYYGEEIGMTGSGRDENKRLPILWDSPASPGYCLPPPLADQAASVQGSIAAQLEDEESLLNHYRWLLQLRQRHPALRVGRLSPVETGESSLCAYTLQEETETVLVMHNLGKETVSVEIDGKAYTVPAAESVIEPLL